MAPRRKPDVGDGGTLRAMKWVWIVGLAGVCAGATGCGGEDTTMPEGSSVLGADYEHAFPLQSIAAGEERSDLCASWKLGNEETLYVNAVELAATRGGFHHSNWVFTPETGFFEGEEGLWPCDERGFNEAIAATTGGVLFAQSTQSRHEEQRFAEGVTLVIPPHAQVIGALHMLNTGSAELEADLALGLHTIEASEVTTELSGLSFTNEALALPPSSESEFRAECDLSEKHREELGRAPDFNIYWVLPHYHDLGVGMRIEAYGPDGSEVIFDGDNPIGDPLGQMLDPPFSMKGYDGIRFSCTYENPRPESVGYGIGDQEMCVLLAFTDSTHLWGGGLYGEPGEPSMVNGMPTFVDDACGVLGYPASHAR
jgi:hypothetical protein